LPIEKIAVESGASKCVEIFCCTILDFTGFYFSTKIVFGQIYSGKFKLFHVDRLNLLFNCISKFEALNYTKNII